MTEEPFPNATCQIDCPSARPRVATCQGHSVAEEASDPWDQIQKHQLWKKACVKADDSFCQDVEVFVVGEAGCLDCLDKMFTEHKTAGLGMMNDVAHVRIY